MFLQGFTLNTEKDTNCSKRLHPPVEVKERLKERLDLTEGSVEKKKKLDWTQSRVRRFSVGRRLGSDKVASVTGDAGPLGPV